MKALRVATAFLAAGFGVCAAQTVVSGRRRARSPRRRTWRLWVTTICRREARTSLLVREQNGRWIAYIGHHGGTEKVGEAGECADRKPEFNGTSVLDVTDPRAPRYLAHIPGEEGQGESGGAQMVRVCSGKGPAQGRPRKVLPASRTFGDSAHEIWDVDRSRQARPAVAHRSAQGHAQELVGVRHRASPTSSPASKGGVRAA